MSIIKRLYTAKLYKPEPKPYDWTRNPIKAKYADELVAKLKENGRINDLNSLSGAFTLKSNKNAVQSQIKQLEGILK